jgi:fatty acid desaturase
MTHAPFALPEASGSNVHRLVLDLRMHSPRKYWCDLLLCSAIFWGVLALSSYSLVYLPITLMVGSLALYRMALFSHEICHFKHGTLPGFTLAWNVLCGVPVLLPSYMLKLHGRHHARSSYGTAADPEYLPFAIYPQLRARFLWGALMVPLAMVVRALLLVPGAWVSRAWRSYLRERMTFMAMHSDFRPGPNAALSLPETMAEVGTTLWTWGLLITSVLGLVAWQFLAVLLACMTQATLLNSWRTLRAHQYTNDGRPIDFAAQLRDSTTFSGHWFLDELLAPVGQRYHAAHHLMPYLPYHALPEAHRRLCAMPWPGREDYLATIDSPKRQAQPHATPAAP